MARHDLAVLEGDREEKFERGRQLVVCARRSAGSHIAIEPHLDGFVCLFWQQQRLAWMPGKPLGGVEWVELVSECASHR